MEITPPINIKVIDMKMSDMDKEVSSLIEFSVKSRVPKTTFKNTLVLLRP